VTSYEISSYRFCVRQTRLDELSCGLPTLCPAGATAGIGFLLGLSLEESLGDYLAGLPESRLVRPDQETADSGRRLEEISSKC
jgi:hypothetical protein